MSALISPRGAQAAQGPSTQPPQRAAVERCWICLEELRKERGDWAYPCSCSLVCHEECLLHWVAESERRVRSGVVRCPQCSTPYRVVQWKSTTFKVLHTIYGAIDKAMPFFLATAGSVAVLVACAAHGAYTVLTVYGPADGRRVLDAIGGADHSKWMWLPAVPLALVWSRFQIGALYLPLSTLLMTAPQPLRIQWPMPPSLAMAALPTISALYRYVWTHTLGRLERRWESFLPPEQGTLTVHGFGFRHGAGANAGDGETNGNGWPMAAGGQAGTGAADNAPLQQPQQQEQRLGLPIRAGPNFEATIVLNGASLGRTLIESLLLPAISSALGSVIGRLPFARRAGLGTFSRAMLGGCAYFVVKDLIRTLYKYLLYRSCSSRHIEGRKRL